MIELEKKLLISKEEYDYLIERFGYDNQNFKKSTIKQINYYFDTDDFSMNRQNITCRIRLKDGKYKGVMKQHSHDSDHSTETEMAVHDGIISNAFTDMGLKLQGSLTTERCIILKNFNCEVALDKNMYLGYEDYELEIEYTPNHENDAESVLQIFRDMLWCRKYFPAYQKSFSKRPNVPSKSGRFFERKLVTGQPSKERENETEDKPSAKPNESIQKTNIGSFNAMDSFNYSNPYDYMNDYYHSKMPIENVCSSCIYFSGRHCGAPFGYCEYEQY